MKISFLFFFTLLLSLSSIGNIELYAQKTDKVVRPTKDKKRKDKNNYKLHGAGYEPKHKQKLKKDAIKFKADKIKDNSGNVEYGSSTKKRVANDRKTATYSGKVPYVDIKRLRAKKNKKVSEYSGTVRYTDLAKAKARKNKLTSSYAGDIPLRSIKVIRERNIRYKASDMASYSGNVRYVNMRAKYAKRNKKISSSLGPVKIRVRKKPKFAYSSFSKKRANRAKKFSYNRKRFKSGRKVKKSDLPNYQKGKQNKIDYNSREAKWNLNRVKNAKNGKLPKGNKKKSKKSEEVENQGE